MGISPDRSTNESQSARLVRFGTFELDLDSGELRKQGRKIRLADQPFQVLSLLLQRAGRVVTREELQRELWSSDTFVDFDVGLNSAIRKLRDALGDPAENPRFIETIPRRGYRFIGPVAQPAIHEPENVLPDRPRTGDRRWAKWPLTVAMAALLIAATAWLSLGRGWERLSMGLGPPASPRRITSIAVLPFENLSGSNEHDYVVDGITDALTTNLAQLKSLKVPSRTSTAQYKQSSKPLPQIARELHVDAVVEGALARSGDRMHLTVQLIDAASNFHIWANKYDLQVRDLLGLQIHLTETIANEIHVEVRPEERSRLTRSQAATPEAYNEYLKGRFYWRSQSWSSRNPVNLLRAEEHFQKAIALDSTYALAYSGLSDTYRLFDVLGIAAPKVSMPRAEAAARQALMHDDTLAEAHASLAGVLFRYYWKWAEAEEEFKHALALDPGYGEGHRALAVFLMMLRRNEEALTSAQRARELDPLSPAINMDLATALARAGRYDETIRQLRKAQELAPRSPRVHSALAMTYLQMGDPARALATLDQAKVPLSAQPPVFGYLYAIQGRRQEARNILSELQRRAQTEYVSPQHLAVVDLGLGEEQQALALLEQAYEERAFEVIGFSGLLAEILRDTPRFQQILHRMGLAGQPGYAPRKP